MEHALELGTTLVEVQWLTIWITDVEIMLQLKIAALLLYAVGGLNYRNVITQIISTVIQRYSMKKRKKRFV